MPDRDRPLVLVSNRGPVTYQEDGSLKRGTGGLVTALTGLASHRDAIWIASAMTDADVEVSREHGDHSFEIDAPHGGKFSVRSSTCATRTSGGGWAAPARSTCGRISSLPACCVTGCVSSKT